ncbi:MAG: alpha/beta fold hydrolase [Bacteroidia bacterium]|nr:alpha/beta fold hydrolase [Bacteroidia bacterium]
MEIKKTSKLIRVLTIIILSGCLGCGEYQNQQKKLVSETATLEICKEIEFTSLNTKLRGRLYLPDNKSKNNPAVIMAHGFTTTINGMTADKYAENLRESGFAVILYDHRNFGISDGEPRQEINFWAQSRGYIDCIDFAQTLPEVDPDKIAIWGCSLSAEEVFLVGSIDERVKAIVSMVPAVGNVLPSKDQDDNVYTFSKNMVLNDDILDLSQTIFGPTLVVSTDQINNPAVINLLPAYKWFTEYGGRFGSNWKNIVSWSDTDRPPNYHDANFSQHLKAPILMIVATNDEMEYSNDKVTLEVFKRITQPKEWVDIDGGHFGLLYYPSELFDKSSKAQIEFLNKYLK